MREALAENTKLQLIEEGTKNQFDIIVGSVIGKGASCVVYDAVRVAGDKQYKIRLKQFNPLFSNYDVKRFEAGAKKNIEIQNVISNSTSKVFGVCTDENQNPFVIVDYDDGMELSKCNNINFLDFADVCKSTAIALKKYHELGWLHLDIKPSNILMINSDGMKGVKLFDFDSVIEEKEIGSKDVVISCSQNYAAPEVVQGKINQTTKKADFYSIGAMMFEFLFGKTPSSMDRSIVSANRDFSKAEALNGINPKIEPLLKTFLNKTIVSSPARRYDSDDELIEALQKIVETANEKHYLISSFQYNKEFFIGRSNEIQKIHEALRNSNVVFLSGIGGIGKSELAKAYANEFKSCYSSISFGVCSGNLTSFIINDSIVNINAFNLKSQNEMQAYYNKKIQLLSSIVSETDLIIVDNFDNINDPILNELLSLECKFIFTTRNIVKDANYQSIHIERLSNDEDVLQIFKHYYDGTLSDEEQNIAKNIIKLVDYHTITVELLSKQINSSFIDIQEMYSLLKNAGISSVGEEQVIVNKDGQISAYSSIEWLKIIFDIADLNDNKLSILKNLSIIPSTGILATAFKEYCSLDSLNDINQLIASGWIQRNQKRISLHPIIAETIFASCDIDFDSCRNLIASLTEQFNKSTNLLLKSNDVIAISKYTPLKLNISCSEMADFCMKCLKILNGGVELDSAIKLCQKLEEYSKGDKCSINQKILICYSLCMSFKSYTWYSRAEKYLVQVEQYLNKSHTIDGTKLAEIYRDFGNLYKNSTDYFSAIKYYEIALKLRKEQLGEEHIEIAKTYNNIGIAYMKNGQFQKALEYHNKALTIINNSDDSDKQQLIAWTYTCIGESYVETLNFDIAIKKYNEAIEILNSVFGNKENENNIFNYWYLGEAYSKMDNYEMAIKYHNIALELRKSIFGEKSQAVANSLSILSDINHKFERNKTALEIAKECLELRKEIFGENSDSVAWSYDSIARIYAHSNVNKAIEYAYKAIKIREKQFAFLKKAQSNGKELVISKIMVESHCLLGELYSKIYNSKKAEENYNIALEIAKQLYGENRGVVAHVYNEMGNYYTEINTPLSIDCHMNALLFRKELYGENHLEVAKSYQNLSISYETIGDYETAIKFVDLAIAIKSVVLNNESNTMNKSCQLKGILLAELTKYEEAYIWFEKAYILSKKIFAERKLHSAYYQMIKCQYFSGKYDKVDELANGYFYKYKDELNKSTVLYKNICILLAYNDIKLGKIDSINDFIEKQLRSFAEECGEGTVEYASKVNTFAYRFMALRFFDEAKTLLDLAYKIAIESGGPDHKISLLIFDSFGDLYSKKKEYQKAKEYYETSLESRIKCFTQDDIMVLSARKKIVIIDNLLENSIG